MCMWTCTAAAGITLQTCRGRERGHTAWCCTAPVAEIMGTIHLAPVGLLPFQGVSVEQRPGEEIFLTFPAPHLKDIGFFIPTWVIACCYNYQRTLKCLCVLSGFRVNQQAKGEKSCKLLSVQACLDMRSILRHNWSFNNIAPPWSSHTAAWGGTCSGWFFEPVKSPPKTCQVLNVTQMRWNQIAPWKSRYFAVLASLQLMICWHQWEFLAGICFCWGEHSDVLLVATVLSREPHWWGHLS